MNPINKAQNNSAGYILLEIMISIAVSGLLISSLVVINKTLLELWSYNQAWTNLQQETRASMNSIITRLQSAAKIKVVTEDKLLFWLPRGTKQEIFYQPGKGLCLNDSVNKLSSRITEVSFSRQSNNLLQIKVQAKLQEITWSLTTAVAFKDDQLGG